MQISIEPTFVAYVEAATVRLGYLFSDLTFAVDGAAIQVLGKVDGREAEVRRAALHSIYREKVYQETLPLRTLMYRDLLS